MTRVAAVDCGTNSIRLLVADVDTATATQVDLDRRMEIVRLGQGVDRTGRLAPDALARTLAALAGYSHRASALGVERTRVIATSATRDAANRDDFVGGVVEVLGVPPEVVTGDEEARLSFTGATRALPGDVPGPYLVVDIGGGSTELVLGSAGRTGESAGASADGPGDGAGGGTADVTAAVSVDIGCVRLTERHLHDDPPTAEQVAAAVADIEAGLDRAATAIPLRRARSLVGLAGSVTTVAGIALDLPEYDAERIHHSRVSAADVRAVTERLMSSTHAERAAIPVMHPGRVDVIGAGALVLHRIVERVGLPEVVVSEHDILDGIAWSLV
ncbi:MAG TPA: Ppx/GppA phosphatase family protein [Jiangellales bacterium]|nr:Ppx/GppA phosphatase family protein [Jiangellales bacterium]